MGLVVLIQYTSITDKQLERWNRTTATSAHYSERSAVTKIIATVAVQVQIHYHVVYFLIIIYVNMPEVNKRLKMEKFDITHDIIACVMTWCL